MEGVGDRKQRKTLSWATARRTTWAVVALLVSLAVLTAGDVVFEEATGIAAGSPFSSDAGKPDLRFGYSHDQLVDLFERYGADGRRAYVLNLALDTVYPIVLALAGILLAARAFPALRWPWIAPLGFAVPDVVENGLMAFALSRYPDIPVWVAAVASPITQVKLVFLPLAYLVAIVAFLVLAKRWLGSRRRRPAERLTDRSKSP